MPKSSDRTLIAIAAWVILAGLAATVTGCTDRSRAMNAVLRDRIHKLEEANRGLKQAQAEQGLRLEAILEDEPAGSNPELGSQAIPLVTSIEIDSSSGRRREPNAQGHRPLEIYIRARDGRHRPVQLAGTLRVQVTRIAEGEPPLELGVVELTPDAVRDAWRGGFGPPTWLAEIPIDEDMLGPETTSLDVDVFYRDLRTGQRLTCGDKVDIR
jgi:hypothetical protein